MSETPDVAALNARIKALEAECDRLQTREKSRRIVRVRPKVVDGRPDESTAVFTFPIADEVGHLVVHTAPGVHPDHLRAFGVQFAARMKETLGDKVVPLVLGPQTDVTVLELLEVDTTIDAVDGHSVDEWKRRAAMWEETAAQESRNSAFWRGLLMQVGKTLGPAAFTSDDGVLQDQPLGLKIPELVQALVDARPEVLK